MNRLFYPGADKSDRPGLEKHHQLIEQGKSKHSKLVKRQEKQVRESLPNNWIYSENRANEVWAEVERSISVPDRRDFVKEDNPFQKIDESAARIRNTILNFEVHDQEFLVQLMELMGDDSFTDSLNQESILLEAQMRLKQMIEEHVQFGERQAHLLKGLTTWFTELQNSKDFDMTQYTQKIDMNKLKDLLEGYFNNTSENLEKAEALHQDLIQNLSEKVIRQQRIIAQKDLELSQMNQSYANNALKGKARKRNVFNVRDAVNYDSELANSQRKVMELQQQLTSLKQSLEDYTKLKKSDSLARIILENTEPTNTMTNLKLSPDQKQQLDFSNDKSETLISVEKEIEFESKIRVLASQIKNLKDDNKTLREQILQNKQSEANFEQKINALDRQKKVAENTLQATNKKLEQMKETYEQKIQELTKQNQDLILMNNSKKNSENAQELRKEYEKKMQKLKNEYRANMEKFQEMTNKQYEKKMKQVISSYDKQGDSSKAFDVLSNQYQQQITEIQEQNKQYIKEEKKRNSEKMNEIVSNYEEMLKKKDLQIEQIQQSLQNEIKNKELEMQIEFEEKMNTNNIEINEKMVNEVTKLKNQMQSTVTSLKTKLAQITQERDTLRSLIEANDIAVDLMDEMEEEANEEEEIKPDQTDDVFLQNLQELKEKEIEAKLSSKYEMLMKAQSDVFKDINRWHIDQAKNFFEFQYLQNVHKNREHLAEFINRTKSEMSSGNEKSNNKLVSESLDNLLLNTLKQTNADTGDKILSMFNNPVIPVSEVDSKLQELKDKLTSLVGENELWKSTFGQIQKDTDMNGLNEESAQSNLKDFIETQVHKIKDLEQENKLLNKKINSLKKEQADAISEMESSRISNIKSQILLSNPTTFQFTGSNQSELEPHNLRNDSSVLFNLTPNPSEHKIHTQNSNDKINDFNERSTIQSNNELNKDQTETHNNNLNNINNTAQSPNNKRILNPMDMINNTIECFHCHKTYTPSKIHKQVVECHVSTCPDCNHLTVLPQVNEVDDLAFSDSEEDEEANREKLQNDSPNKSTDLVSMDNPPNENSQNADKMTVKEKSLSSSNDKIENENHREQKDDNKIEEMEKKLNKSIEKNQKLKSKMKLVEKHFNDLEQQYIKKINSITDDISNMQKMFFSNSLHLVENALNLSNEGNEHLETKTRVCQNVAKTLEHMGLSATKDTEKSINDFILSSKQLLENPPTFDSANESLNHAKTALLKILKDPLALTQLPVINSSKSIDMKFIASLRLCKSRIKTYKNNNDKMNDIIHNLLNEYENMLNRIKTIMHGSLEMSLNLKKENLEISKKSNKAIEQKTKELDVAQETIQKQQKTLDDLQEQLRNSVSMVEQLNLQTIANSDESSILQRKEFDQTQSIVNLTNNLLKSQEEIRQKDKEIEQLKLKIIEVESDCLIKSASDAQFKTNENYPNKGEILNTEISQSYSARTLQGANTKEPNALYYVPPFVIFSSSINQTGKGFSLLPRNTILSESDPISKDILKSNKISRYSNIKMNDYDAYNDVNYNERPFSKNDHRNYKKNFYLNHPEGIYPVEGKQLPVPKKREKIRVKYANIITTSPNHNFSITSKSNAKVVIPKSRPKSSLSANTEKSNDNNSTPSNVTNKNTNDNNKNDKMTRVLSFDNLLPLSIDDPTGSLIGYVTRYVNANEISKENPLNSPQKNKIRLVPSDFLISEVPPNKLKFELPQENMNENISDLKPQQKSQESKLNDAEDKRKPTNDNRNEITKAQIVTNMDNRLSQKFNDNSKSIWLDTLQRRIKQLESVIQDKTRIIQEEKDKSHYALKSAFKANSELQVSKRQERKLSLLLDATKKRLSQALDIIKNNDHEIARLKKFISEVSQIAKVIQTRHDAKITQETLAQEKKPTIYQPSKYDDESEKLLSIFRGVASGLTSMAEQEIKTIRRWAPKREQYILEERNKLYYALKAMNLIKERSPDEKDIETNEKTRKQRPNTAVIVTSMKQPNSRKRRIAKEQNEPIVSIDEATIIANAHNQKVPYKLQKGIIGKPATSSTVV